MEVSGWLQDPDALHPWKDPRYPLNRRMGGPQSRSWRFEEDKDFCPYRDSNPGPSSPQPSRCTDSGGCHMSSEKESDIDGILCLTPH
jgi:hypothetical protein